MDSIDEGSSNSFGFPTDFKVLLWATEVGLLVFGGSLPFLIAGKPNDRLVAIGCTLFFGTLALLLLPILRRLSESIHIDDRAIICATRGGPGPGTIDLLRRREETT